jgi:transcriptional regulator with XRE-family HTH domain
MQRERLIQELRERYPNQAELAKVLGVHPSLASHIFTGRREPSIGLLRRIRTRIPELRVQVELALYEILLAEDAPIGAPPAESREHEATLAG